ncbi:Rieske (2Fe-2S) protein [Natronorubrum aibiense]|uniref:Rieske 2Fe-2S domain-containing protein n=1 Tax=Natronorubrum aibiense TaxID=348826 RepID=A0A5P9P6A9_9EURY|nr:Rieske 2Fe-2S domain-containing protein [Natronorubrum aibiense]QFU83330.1 Rieske 2Fe-2S domain-containing protein [Natronorubrum aibiense]
MDASQRITALETVPTDSTVLFRVTNGADGPQEAILVATESGADEPELACWLNYCQHLTHIKIDKGSGAPMRDGELVCANHGAYFDADSGECTHGPCEGAYLSALEITVADGDVYLTDDEYTYLGVGPIDDGDELTSTSNVEF